MDGIVALDVAIGLTFMFFLLSIIASGLGEWISRMLTLRAKTLRDGIRHLIVEGDDKELTKLFNHSSIKSLSKQQSPANKFSNLWLGKTRHWIAKNGLRREPGPSAIAARRFVACVGDVALSDDPKIVATQLFDESVQTLMAKLDDAAKDGLKILSDSVRQELISVVESVADKTNELDSHINQIRDRLPEESRQPFTDLVDQLKTVIEERQLSGLITTKETFDTYTKKLYGGVAPSLKEPVNSIAATVRREVGEEADRYVEFRDRFEKWYDEKMDRVGGWYKRKMQIVLVIIGVILAFGLNINTFTVANELWTNDADRDSIVLQASGVNQEVDDKKAQELIDSLPLPIGWIDDEADPRYVNWSDWNGEESGKILWYHVFGWLATAAALAFGAPFWFDLMNRLVDLRGGGKDTSKKPEEDAGGSKNELVIKMA